MKCPYSCAITLLYEEFTQNTPGDCGCSPSTKKLMVTPIGSKKALHVSLILTLAGMGTSSAVKEGARSRK